MTAKLFLFIKSRGGRSVFRYFGTTESEILIPNTELLNDYANYRNTGTESWVGTCVFSVFWAFWKGFQSNFEGLSEHFEGFQSILKAFQSIFLSQAGRLWVFFTDYRYWILILIVWKITEYKLPKVPIAQYRIPNTERNFQYRAQLCIRVSLCLSVRVEVPWKWELMSDDPTTSYIQLSIFTDRNDWMSSKAKSPRRQEAWRNVRTGPTAERPSVVKSHRFHALSDEKATWPFVARWRNRRKPFSSISRPLIFIALFQIETSRTIQVTILRKGF